MYEYGSRAGFWRIHELFTRYQLPLTVFACGRALELNPEATQAMRDAKWEVASHGYRWLDYQNVAPEVEQQHISKTIKIHQNLLGYRPIGFYQGKPNVNTRRYAVERGFVYDNDNYSDDMPFWNDDHNESILIIPYALDTNDYKFASGGFATGDDFFNYLKGRL
eukprot:Platyproteum_vivax@DN6174_c0_g1_i2.p1